MGLNDNFIGLYHFTGNTVTDSSGNGNDLTNVSTTSTTDKNSVSNNARNHSGSGQYLTTPSIVLGNKFTVSGWFYKTDTSTGSVFSTNAGTRIQMYFDASNFYYYLDGTTSISFAYSINTWYHWAITSDGTNKELFINGVSQGTQSSSVNLSANTYYLGRLGAGITSYDFAGKTDEVRIYDSVLTQYEIVQLYYGYDTDDDKVNTLLDGDLTAYYKFEGDVTDETGTYNGTNVNSTDTSSGKIGNGREFNGSSAYVSTTQDNDNTSFTYAIWANTDTIGAARGFMGQSASNTANFHGMYINASGVVTGQIQVQGGTSSTAITGSALSIGTYSHCILSYNGSTLKLYQDGVLKASTSYTWSGGTANGSIYFGSYGDYLTSLFWDGKLDEAGTWSRALSDGGVSVGNTAGGEIAELYNTGSGLTYPFTTSSGWSGKINNITPSKVNNIGVVDISKINNV